MFLSAVDQWSVAGAVIEEDVGVRYGGRPFCFAVHDAVRQRVLVLQCCNGSELRTWVDALRRESQAAVCYEGVLSRFKKIKRVCVGVGVRALE